jgi:hypothetical protein
VDKNKQTQTDHEMYVSKRVGFLLGEHYEASDLYAEALTVVSPLGGTLSVDDTVLDKPYAN